MLGLRQIYPQTA